MATIGPSNGEERRNLVIRARQAADARTKRIQILLRRRKIIANTILPGPVVTSAEEKVVLQKDFALTAEGDLPGDAEEIAVTMDADGKLRFYYLPTGP